MRFLLLGIVSYFLFVPALFSDTKSLVTEVNAICQATESSCAKVYCKDGGPKVSAYILEHMARFKDNFSALGATLDKEWREIRDASQQDEVKYSELDRELDKLKGELKAIPSPPEDADLATLLFGSSKLSARVPELTAQIEKVRNDLKELGHKLGSPRHNLERLTNARKNLAEAEKKLVELLAEIPIVQRFMANAGTQISEEILLSKLYDDSFITFARVVEKSMKAGLVKQYTIDVVNYGSTTIQPTSIVNQPSGDILRISSTEPMAYDYLTAISFKR